MVFSSVIFLFVFLPITLGIYFLINPKWRNIWLLCASLLFYSWGEPKYIVLMLVSIVSNYFFALEIDKRAGRIKKVELILSIALNLGLLIYFKYFNFIIENINNIFNKDIKWNYIALPIGISFFTFQSMSYVIDVYRKKANVQRNILYLALYISLFPQLIAGPIVRYEDVEKQIVYREITIDKAVNGIRRFMIGFSKKVLIADQLAPFVDAAFSSQNLSAPLAWTGAIAYTLQIYFDFSGYSDMAIGLGKIFGFDFLENFNYPYVSKSIKEFWRRWHISLSSWFRDYVYIPLGGSRKGVVRTYVNLFIVFLLTGIWHGASWNFVVWGLYYVVFLIIERMGFDKILNKLPIVIQHIYACIIIIIGWIFFRADSLTAAIKYIKALFVFNSRSLVEIAYYIDKQYIFCLIIGIVCSVPCIKIKNTKVKCIVTVLLFLLAIIYMVGSGYSPFLYFRF